MFGIFFYSAHRFGDKNKIQIVAKIKADARIARRFKQPKD
jgi:hypothetical protein